VKQILPWILAVASGLALALAMPGPGLGPLALLFPVLLLEAIERAPGRRSPWLLGWLAGTVFWVVSTNWVIPVMHHYGGLPQGAAVGCLVGMGAYLGVLWAVATGLTSLVPTAWRFWLFPAAWISLGVLQRFPPYGFTWTSTASAFVDWPWLMASLPVWGATGLGWCVVALSSAVWGLFQFDTRKRAAVALAFSAFALLVAVLIAPAPEPTGEELRVAAIQPGTTLEEKWDPSQAREIADRVWAMTAEAAVRGADLVLWPESAVPYQLDGDAAYREAVEKMAEQFEIDIVLNSVAPLDRGGYSNSAFLVTGRGVSPVRYDKVHLVPFGEFVPVWARLAFTESLVREVGAFGGAQLLTTLTNDGWYGFSWAPRQHFAQVRLRAAETRRWFARAALTGISGFIDPMGRVVSRLDVGEAGILAESVQPMTGLTPRVRFGDWWAMLCAVATVVILVASRVRRRPQRKVKSQE
jgi:apolipoprotein N-acyltransferase